MIKKFIKWSLASLLVVIALVVFFLVYMHLHAYHLSPIARLYKGIDMHDDYANVKIKFDRYVEKHYKNQNDYKWNNQYDVSSKSMWLYEYHFLDDYQLVVNFDQTGKVSNIEYIAD